MLYYRNSLTQNHRDQLYYTCDEAIDTSDTGLGVSDGDLVTARTSDRAGQEAVPPITEAASATPFNGLFQAGLLGRPGALPSPFTSELSTCGSEPELSITELSGGGVWSTGGDEEGTGGGAAAAAAGDEFCSESPRTMEAHGEGRLCRRECGLLTPPPLPLGSESEVGGELSTTILGEIPN